MILTETKLRGAYIVEIEPMVDHRGFFARTWCSDEFSKRGLKSNFVQCNISYNDKMGTLRGMHYQVAPHEEVKIIRCTRGAIYDVIIDLRPKSDTYKQWISIELTETNRKMLYIPQGMAHGFQTMVDNVEVFYQMGDYYFPEFARGIRWDDRAFNIQWIKENKIISKKDMSYEDFR